MRDLSGAPGFRAFIQHPGGHVGEAGQGIGIVDGAGLDQNIDRDDGKRRLVHDEDDHVVRGDDPNRFDVRGERCLGKDEHNDDRRRYPRHGVPPATGVASAVGGTGIRIPTVRVSSWK